MKKLILTAALAAASVAAFGQGTIDIININHNGGFVAPIFQPNPASPNIPQTGQPSSSVYSGALPTGTTVYGGLPVTSAYDMVVLYSLNNAVTSPSQMTVATIVPFRTSANATGTPAGGIINISTLALGTVASPAPGGTPIAFCIGGFFVDTADAAAIAGDGGNLNSAYASIYADWAAGNGAMGWSSIVPNIILGGTDSNNVLHPEPNTQEGWTSFSLYVTPEPSTFVLAGLGAAGLLLFRRKK